MFVVVVCMFVAFLTFDAGESFARGIFLTSEQKNRLKSTQTISLKVVALTEKGHVRPDPIADAVSQRLRTLGYTIIENSRDPHDIVLKVKCEERRTWVGITECGGDADQMDAPSRSWKGPACQVTYFMGKRRGRRQLEVRTDFENAMEAAKQANASDSGAFALEQLQKKLEIDDFPFDLTAQWRQTDRLLTILEDPDIDHHLQLTIISLLGRISESTSMDALQNALGDPTLATEATRSLGHLGERAKKTLLHLLETSETTSVRVAAAEGLGKIGARSGDTSLIPPLLAMMQKPDIDLAVQTEIVRTLGTVPDEQVLQPLEELNLKVWTIRSDDPQVSKLREAVVWSLQQVLPGAHTD